MLSPIRAAALVALASTMTSAGVDDPAPRLRVGRLDANPREAVRALGLAAVPTGPSSPTARGKSASTGGVGQGVALTNDADGDGLTDAEEMSGWDIVIDEFGYGVVAEGSLLTIKTVTSDPMVADTDGDGLDDGVEAGLGSDPRDADTDGDGLLDPDELGVWLTSMNSVDTDGDCRGPSGELAPNIQLFDGAELDASSLPRTSPSLADTDGDGRTDFEEFAHPFFSPVISEVPSAAITVEGTMDVRLDVEYAESVVQQKAYETSFSISESTSKGKEKSSSHSETSGWTSEYSFGFEESVEVEGGVPPTATGSVSANQQFTESTNGEVTKEKGFTVSTETAKTSEQTSSQYVSDSTEFTETAASGSITLPIRIENDGAFAYTLTNLGVTLLAWDPDPTSQSGGEFKSMGTLTPDLPSVTLAPGEATPILNLDSGDLNADVVKSFLANPSTLILQPSIFDMQNADGVDFDFITETTFTQTALVEIDYGGGNVETYRVATNIDREDGEYSGIRMDTVLEDVLGIPYAWQTRKDENGVNLKGINDQGAQVNILALTEVNGVASEFDQQAGTVTSFWSVQTDADLSKAVTSIEDDGLYVSFRTIRLFAGDSIRLIYSEDRDGDGMWASQEADFGTSDTDADSDDDGLDDWKEAISGWNYQAPGGTVRVYSDPRNPDTDFDGLDDAAEQAIDTDPQNPDTDGDGIRDGDDPSPKNAAARLFVSATASGGGDGLTWGSAMTLHEALAAADAANSNGPTGDDVAAIWVERGAYDSGGTPFDMPAGAISLLGGFTFGALAPGDRDSDPTTNETVIYDSVGAGNVVRFNSPQADGTVPAGTIDGFSFTGVDGETRVIRVAEGRATLRNVLMSGNNTTFGTIGIFNNGSVVAEDCDFLQNQCTGSGGAVFDGGIERSTFVDCNFSLNLAGENGGAYYRDTFDPMVDGVPSPPRFERCTFYANQVYYTGPSSGKFDVGGGAIHVDGGADVIDCDFFGNKTQSTLNDPEFAFGTNSLRGGAIRYDAEVPYDARLDVVNCRFFENVSGFGGAIYIHNITTDSDVRAVNIVNSTIVRNRALKEEVQGEKASGGVHFNSPSGGLSGVVKVRNTLLWDNITDGKSNPGQLAANDVQRAQIRIENFDPFLVDVSYSTIKGMFDAGIAYIGNANNDDNPLFVSTAGGNLRLTSDSPAIDAGVNVVDLDLSKPGFQPLPPLDLEGNPRIVEGDGFGDAVVDRGAYEYQP